MRTDWSRAVRLSTVEFLACWAALRLADTPLALELRSVGATLDERDRIYRAALAGMARRGLVDPVAPPVPCRPLAGALRLLATAPYVADLRLAASASAVAPSRGNGAAVAASQRNDPAAEGNEPAELVAVGAMAGEYGLVTVRVEAELMLLPVPAGWVPATLVELVGPLTPARARPVNIPAELLDRACRSAADDLARAAPAAPDEQAPAGATRGGTPNGVEGIWALADRLVEYGVLPTDASSLARMCTGLTAAGQLGVTVRDRDGRERRGRWVVGFHRGRAGDCLQLRRPTGPGQHTVTVAPVTAATLLGQFGALLDDVRAASGPAPGTARRPPRSGGPPPRHRGSGDPPGQMAYGQPVNA